MNLTYEEFKIALTTEVTNMVEQEVNVTLHKVQKNNGVVLDAISVLKPGVYVAPSIYICELYEHYKNGLLLSALAQKVLRLSEEGRLQGIIPPDFFMDYQKIKDRICYRVINYEKNKKLLETVPHKKVLDLAMIFFYSVEPEIVKNASVMIRNVDLQRWGIDAAEIFRRAKENTPRVQPWQLITISELLEQIIDGEELDFTVTYDDGDPIRMYILTNEEKYYGAGCIFYPHLLEKIAQRLENHFYILPSSVHECIIMPASGGFSKESLSALVTEINESQLEEVEVLSDRAYFYNRDTNCVS